MKSQIVQDLKIVLLSKEQKTRPRKIKVEMKAGQFYARGNYTLLQLTKLADLLVECAEMELENTIQDYEI